MTTQSNGNRGLYRQTPSSVALSRLRPGPGHPISEAITSNDYEDKELHNVESEVENLFFAQSQPSQCAPGYPYKTAMHQPELKYIGTSSSIPCSRSWKNATQRARQIHSYPVLPSAEHWAVQGLRSPFDRPSSCEFRAIDGSIISRSTRRDLPAPEPHGNSGVSSVSELSPLDCLLYRLRSLPYASPCTPAAQSPERSKVPPLLSGTTFTSCKDSPCTTVPKLSPPRFIEPRGQFHILQPGLRVSPSFRSCPRLTGAQYDPMVRSWEPEVRGQMCSGPSSVPDSIPEPKILRARGDLRRSTPGSKVCDPALSPDRSHHGRSGGENIPTFVKLQWPAQATNRSRIRQSVQPARGDINLHPSAIPPGESRYPQLVHLGLPIMGNR